MFEEHWPLLPPNISSKWDLEQFLFQVSDGKSVMYLQKGLWNLAHRMNA